MPAPTHVQVSGIWLNAKKPIMATIGSLKNRIGETRLASAKLKDRVKQNWAHIPAIPNANK